MKATARSNWRWPSSTTTSATRSAPSRSREPFMKKVVANLDNDWTLTGGQIDAFLRGSVAA